MSTSQSKSLTSEKTAHCEMLVAKVVEPKIHKLVQEFNVVLARHGALAGCEIQWFFDKLPDKPAASQGDSDDEN